MCNFLTLPMNGLGIESAKTDLGGGTGAKMTGKRQLTT